MLDSDKIYEFSIGFGVESDTLDGEGIAIAESDVRPTLPEVEAVLPRFTGPIEQVPPVYSALKVDGERAYDLARAGEEVVLATRAVTVHSLAVAPAEAGAAGVGALPSPSSPAAPASAGATADAVTLTAHVSKGTYIRSLARDIAHALGTVGHVTYLRRVKAGPFDLSHAISLDKLTESANARRLEQILLPLRAGLDDIPALSLDPDQAGALRQGRVLVGIAEDDGLHFAMLGETPVALVEVESGEARIVRGFNC